MERETTKRGRDETTRDIDWRRVTRYILERKEWRTEAELDQSNLDNAKKREEILVKENAQLKALLETRRQELQDAQRFMRTVDTFAESEVVQEVRSLNTEIFNLARSIADQATPNQDQHTVLGAEDDVIRALGHPFLAVLKSTDTRGDTILVEIATQVAVTNFLARIISTWTNDSESDNVLTSVYERIRKSGKHLSASTQFAVDLENSAENQSVVGQWRALTRKFAQAEHLDAEQLDDSCSRELAKLLRHVVLSSCMRPSAESDPQQPIHILVSKALKIRHLIAEAMKGSEYEILLPRPDTAFVAEEMEDIYGDSKKERRTRSCVLCCVSLGLRRVEKVEGSLRSATLVKPGVGIQTLVDDLCLADGDD
ncbi:uncharacterized protein B0H18DRAFT_1011140, partial [Fomitopsis serialis]|uniref:uncharacterized protein n=1 Tax=Fomitopsis serialis TaxID=139415 RepID=UPI00200868C2